MGSDGSQHVVRVHDDMYKRVNDTCGQYKMEKKHQDETELDFAEFINNVYAILYESNL